MREVSIEMFPLEIDVPVKKNPSLEYIENIISQGMVADRFSLRRSLKNKYLRDRLTEDALRSAAEAARRKS